jgi:hypothetical protein
MTQSADDGLPTTKAHRRPVSLFVRLVRLVGWLCVVIALFIVGGLVSEYIPCFMGTASACFSGLLLLFGGVIALLFGGVGGLVLALTRNRSASRVPVNGGA